MSVKWIAIVLAAVAVGGVAYWGISPLFISIEADDPLPTAGATATPAVEKETASNPPETSRASSVVGTLAHPASGTVRILTSEGKTYVRYENLKTINGPDIFVYLSKDLDAKEFVNLGRVKATEGNVNYEVPEGVKASDYRYVLTWCRAFGVLFNYADLETP